ncbi:MAG: phosphate-starvation-inducible PsiE family protein, partial [Thiohalorhabdaceae bacterium]
MVTTVALVGIAVLVLVALWNLVSHLAHLIIGANLDPHNHKVFHEVFSGIMTVLIAMEFKHSILRWAVREESIIQVKTVLVIAILALARKFIILDLETTSA